MPAAARAGAPRAGSSLRRSDVGAERRYLQLLGRADLPAVELEEVLRNAEARRFHAVRLALAAHRGTPRGEALSLVETLFWRGLAHLSADARVHPEIRRAADVHLLRRLPEMALAERVDLARTVGRGVLLALRQDPEPRVLAALLDNRFATEPDVVQAAARAGAMPQALAVIAQHPRWSSRRAVRQALLGNPALPMSAAGALIAGATDRELANLVEHPGGSPVVRALAQRTLARRAEGG
jgi:hypothetical protein